MSDHMSEQIRRTSRTVTDSDPITGRITGQGTDSIDGPPAAWRRPVEQRPVEQVAVEQVAFEQAPAGPRVVEPAPVQYARVDAVADRAADVAGSPASVDQVRTVDVTATRRRVSPASIMAGAASLALMVFGGVAIARAGTDTPLDLPVVEVFGFTATAILGLIVLGAGGVLLLAAFSGSRAAIAFVSILLGVGAAIVAIEPSFGQASLATERDFAIAGLILLGITAAVALIAPDVDQVDQRRSEHVG